MDARSKKLIDQHTNSPSMSKRTKTLLTIDAIVNLLLGLILLLFPLGMADMLGAPDAGDGFYATMLGAVLFGIGLGLLAERYGYERGFRGLGASAVPS